MKKLMCAALVLMLALTLCIGATAEDVTGLWYLNTYEMAGMSLNAASIGLADYIIELRKDYTCTMSVGDDAEEGTWAVDENGAIALTDAEGNVMTCVPGEDGTLSFTLEEEGLTMTLVFGREQAVAEIFEAGEVCADPALQDFNGTWTLFLMDSDGMQVPSSSLGAYIMLTIADGSVTLDVAYDETSASDVTVEASLSDGALSIDMGMEVEGFSSLTLSLHEGGQYMSATVEEGTVLYFEKIAD